MKNFFNKVKTDIKFKKAGEGHKLNEESSSTAPSTSRVEKTATIRTQPFSEVQIQSASAAISRYEETKNPPRPKKKVPYQTARMIEPESNRSSSSRTDEPKAVSLEAAPVLSVLGVHFISPFTDEKLARSELRDHYREQLIMRLADDGIKASSQMIHTLNKDKDKLKIAVETLCKYIENIIKNPTEEKYKKIRKGNKIFTRLSEVEGCEEFLQAVGFKPKLLKSPNSEDAEEIYYVLENDVLEEFLTNAQYILASTEPLKSKLFRNTTVFKALSRNMKFSLPSEFYKITSTELKKEQQNKTEEVERNKQLRTKAMREREAQNTIKKYNFTLIRIRFPGDWILQGTFRVTEKLSDLNSFVRECINHDWVPFELRTALGSLINGEDESLAALELVPAAVVNLSWNEDIKIQIQSQKLDLGIKLELLQNAQTF